MSYPLAGFGPGDELPNGATLLDTKNIAKDEAVVLCIDISQASSRHRFVTWRVPTFDASATMWGHYFDELDEALADFQKRYGG